MSKSLSFTVHPDRSQAEYLTVSDALRQVLDLVEVLEKAESFGGTAKRIVWRLTEAHTNSPPFTVSAEAFSVDPQVSILFEASRVTDLLQSGLRQLLGGELVDWIDQDVARPLKRIMQRSLNGIGLTQIDVPGAEPLDIDPSAARLAVSTLDQLAEAAEQPVLDQARTEHGAVEVEISGISRWHNRPALQAVERLSRSEVACVLTDELERQLGTHRWDEVWEGRRLMVSGALHYAHDGALKRVQAELVEDMSSTDVTLDDLADVDVLQGLSVGEHLRRMRDDDLA